RAHRSMRPAGRSVRARRHQQPWRGAARSSADDLTASIAAPRPPQDGSRRAPAAASSQGAACWPKLTLAATKQQAGAALQRRPPAADAGARLWQAWGWPPMPALEPTSAQAS
ncbi:unnamed protein product, partial [Prorocentrum cordatum]